ncbi:MAG: hypothetical protein BGO52_10955 [Sphingobacteriales bacterium 44-61]|nr:MAG: hypothetical protein BGO52_10955 [Sphingobacteriales bacterium 44-61]
MVCPFEQELKVKLAKNNIGNMIFINKIAPDIKGWNGNEQTTIQIKKQQKIFAKIWQIYFESR